MKKIIFILLTTVSLSQAADQLFYTSAMVKDDVKMVLRKMEWMKDSLHTINVKLDSIAKQNKELLNILKDAKIEIKITKEKK